eukprot:7379144-Prymnesium_polylepis.1
MSRVLTERGAADALAHLFCNHRRLGTGVNTVQSSRVEPLARRTADFARQEPRYESAESARRSAQSTNSLDNAHGPVWTTCAEGGHNQTTGWPRSRLLN